MKIFLVSLLALAANLAVAQNKESSFSFMTYNVENLFDTIHDEGKEDYTYLPLTVKERSPEVQDFCASIEHDYFRKTCLELDWNRRILEKKIANLSKVILSAQNWQGPDVLVLQEVENKRALELLVKKGLKGKGYKYISLLEGPDSRGIDVAVISKKPIVKEALHLVDLTGVAKETRGILEVEIKVGKKTLAVFANHWPSQSNPSEARYIAAQTLLTAARASQANLVVAAGDFNTTENDNPHGINLLIKPNFVAAHERAKEMGVDIFEGSHWYRGHWSYLDNIFVLKSGFAGDISPLYETFKVHRKSWMLAERIWTDDLTGSATRHFPPKGFDEKTGEGFSDHLPLYMRFAY